MNSRYKFMLDTTFRVRLVDIYDSEFNPEGYVAEVRKGVKAMYSPGMRRWNRMNGTQVMSRISGIQIMTCANGDVYIGDPSKCDPVPEDCLYICPATALERNYAAAIKKAHGAISTTESLLVNPDLQGQGSRRVARGSENYAAIPGWALYQNSGYGVVVRANSGEGICINNDIQVIMSQLIPKERIGGVTYLKVKADNAVAVSIGNNVMTREEGFWVLQLPEPIQGDTRISVLLPINGVRVNEVKVVEYL